MRSMGQKSMLALFLLVGLVHYGGAANADSSQGIVVPLDLHEYTLEQNCIPVGDFYSSRPGVSVPPYVYAKELGGPYASAALWCREKKGGARKYTLLFRRGNGSVGQGACPPRIPDQDHIGGLSLVYKSDLKLDRFRFMEIPALSGPRCQTLKDVAIKSEYDGVGAIYYYHDGKWLIYQFD